MEEWRGVSGWTAYEVSSEGRVRSLDRYVPNKWGGSSFRKGQVLKPVLHKGYPAVTLRGGSEKEWTVKVHRLVLEAFAGQKPDGLEARHLNGDRQDNRSKNLVWGTRSDNNIDRVRHGTHTQAAKTHCPRGHEYDYTDPQGGRRCRTCRREQFLAFKERKRLSDDKNI